MKQLSTYAKNIYSQFGEDGIIQRIFRILPHIENRWCVEFGAWDGINYSNTHNLINNWGWYGVLIEANKSRFNQLRITYNKNKNVCCINKFVGFSGRNKLDKILQKTNLPKDFDLLSIDIDGNDYYVWESMKFFRPKLVIIEFNPTIPHDVDFRQSKDFNVLQGSSLLSLIKLAKKRDYSLIATTDANAFFVDNKYYQKFRIKNNSPEILHDNKKYLTKTFQLFDGTIVVEGCKRLLWHGINFSQEDFQVIPRYLRRFPNWSNILLVKLFKGDFKALFKLLNMAILKKINNH